MLNGYSFILAIGKELSMARNFLLVIYGRKIVCNSSCCFVKNMNELRTIFNFVPQDI